MSVVSRERIRGILKERVLLLDGAYGTELMKRIEMKDKPVELLNVERPDLVEKLQREYVEAGSDVILTNTFSATPSKLEKHGLSSMFEDIVRNGVRIARRAAKGRAFVLGDVGPTGELPFPMGDKTFDYFYDNFKRQIELMVDEGVDGVILETFSDVLELKAAVLAARDVSNDIFLIAHMTFDENGRSLTGTDPMNFAITFGDLDVDALGINCTLGPEELLPVFQELAKYTEKFLSVEPNAGMPILKDGETLYPVGPEEFSLHVDSYWEAGVNIIGGCCGTGPEHVKKMRLRLGRRKPLSRDVRRVFAVTSPTRVVVLDGFRVIGERINPAGRKKLERAMRIGDIDRVMREAKKQSESGAEILDVNFGVEKTVKEEYMERLILSIAYQIGTPVSVDVQTPEILERLVRSYPGRPLINSFRPVEDEMSKLDILKRYGGVVILLAMDDEVPSSFEDRKRAFEKGILVLKDAGIGEDRVIVDPVVLALGAGGDPMETLKFLEYVSDRGFYTTLGLSNLSFGLPDRSYFNGSFLVMALERGLGSAIMNPLDENLTRLLNSALILLGKRELPRRSVDEENMLVKYLLSGDSEKVIDLVEDLLKSREPLQIVEDYLRPAMEKIGQMYDGGEIFLPQLILSAQTARPAFELLESRMKGGSIGGERVVIATVKGDVHDIGKNIVATVMKSAGYDVLDLGKDVPSERIVETALKVRPLVVALSAMMTTTAPRISEVVELLRRHGLKIPVLVGGASLNEELAKELGADFYAKDASQGVKILRSLEGNG